MSEKIDENCEITEVEPDVILLSTTFPWAIRLATGVKKIEFRKRVPTKKTNILLILQTGLEGESKIVGEAYVNVCFKGTKEDILRIVKKFDLMHPDMDSVLDTYPDKFGAIICKGYSSYSDPVSIKEGGLLFESPQNFIYINRSVYDGIRARAGIIKKEWEASEGDSYSIINTVYRDNKLTVIGR